MLERSTRFGLENFAHGVRIQGVPKRSILHYSRLILENNTCKLNDAFFVQINGTAMGKIFASTYAMLSMGYFELTFYRICINEFGATVGQLFLETGASS